MKPTSKLNILFLIFSFGMTSLHGAPTQNYQTCNASLPLPLNQEEMMSVRGSKLSWPCDSAGPFTVLLELFSVVGFGIYKKVANTIRKQENQKSETEAQAQKEELMREIQIIERETKLKRKSEKTCAN